ncbi:hypothetical protein Emag_001131 [Eimeria magna]
MALSLAARLVGRSSLIGLSSSLCWKLIRPHSSPHACCFYPCYFAMLPFLRLQTDLLSCGLRFGLQRPGGLGSPLLPARVLASSSFASQAGGAPHQGPPSSFGGPHHGPPSSFGGPPVTTLATAPRRTRPGMLPSPMSLEFLAPQKMLSFAIQYILSFRFYFMFMARTTFQVKEETDRTAAAAAAAAATGRSFVVRLRV